MWIGALLLWMCRVRCRCKRCLTELEGHGREGLGAGSYGRKVMDGADAGGSISSWQVALGVGVTLLAITYIGRIAQQALAEVDDSGDLTE